MNARRRPDLFCVVLLALAVAAPVGAESARMMVRRGNELYADGQYSEAINKYNEAEIEQPAAVEPKFNKANSYYRLDDLGGAIDLYRQVAAETKDMALVSKAKYNLGNCFFQRGAKQRDSDLQKALEDMETSITYWRGVLDIDPKNEKAARNIEVARLTIKDILDQINKQQQEQEEEQKQQQQQDTQDEPQDQDQQQGQSQQQDPNQPEDEDQSQQGTDQEQDPNQAQPQEQADQQQQQDQGQDEQQAQQQVVPDTTAQEILDKEQRQKEQRQIRQRTQTQKVERDW